MIMGKKNIKSNSLKNFLIIYLMKLKKKILGKNRNTIEEIEPVLEKKEIKHEIVLLRMYI